MQITNDANIMLVQREKQIEALRDTLKPFADVVDRYNHELDTSLDHLRSLLDRGHFNRALAALEKSK